MTLVEQRIEEGMTIQQVIDDILASNSVHFLAKGTLRAALTKDPVDAYHDIQLVADILKVRMNEALQS